MGPAIATEIILNSELKNRFNIKHVDTRLDKNINSIGNISIKKPFILISIYIKFLFALLSFSPDLVLIPISQSWGGFIKDSIFILLASLANTKIIIHLRGSNFKNLYNSLPNYKQKIFRIILKRADSVIVLGKVLRHIFEDFFTCNNIFVVPNGANYNIKPIINKSNDVIKILYLANLQQTKGIMDNILAIKSLKNNVQNLEFEFNVVGKWRDKSFQKECVQLVNKYNLPIKFHPASFSEEKFKWFLATDIFLFTPNAPEGHPWVIVEALAAGLPIISTDQGAITESVLDNYNGFIVKPNSPQDISAKLSVLLEDNNIRSKFSINSRKLYEEMFTEEKMVTNLENAFNTIIKRQ